MARLSKEILPPGMAWRFTQNTQSPQEETMGLFDNDNDNGSFNSNNGQTPSGFAPTPTTTPTTADAAPETGSAYDFFSNLNPAQQLMAVKTGLVTNVSGSTQDSQQAASGNASTMSGPTTSGSEPAQGNTQDTKQRSTSAEPSYGGSYSGERENPGGNSKQSNSYSRKLTDLEKYYLRGGGYDDDLLDNVTIHAGKPHPNNIFGHDAFVPDGGNIYIKEGVYDPNDINSLKVLTHELQHNVQYRNGMTWIDYQKEQSRNGYERNKYEIEANEMEKQAFERIKALRLQEIRKEYGADPDGTIGIGSR